jgi:hypothetical protein
MLLQVFNCNWHNFHCDCIIHSAVFPPCVLFMNDQLLQSALRHGTANSTNAANACTVLASRLGNASPKQNDMLFTAHSVPLSTCRENPTSLGSIHVSLWLRAGRSGDQIPVGARFFAHVQTGPGAHPASCTMGNGSFPGVKRPGRGADHPFPSSAEVKKG